MYNHNLHQQLNVLLQENELDIAGKDNGFYTRFVASASDIKELYDGLYGQHPAGEAGFLQLLQTITVAYTDRPAALKKRDTDKEAEDYWFLSNQLAGMSLYVDRFAGSLQNMPAKIPYLQKLGVNLLHLMPVFESPAGESDGGYAVSDFRKVDDRFGTLDNLQQLQLQLHQSGMYLMQDIVLNHTSHRHEWATKAKSGDKHYQDFFYMFDDRTLPDQFDDTMPDIFPEVAPGNFTYVEECSKWVMTVFHRYQWDLNYTNPAVFNAMLDTIFFYANIGMDILRIDAPAFIWKQLGTTCQNLPQAHNLLRLIRQCVQVATPGMALLGEAIVAPADIMHYFGTGRFTARECDFAYNATQMALQWDALATGDTRVMLAAQHILLRKPYGTSWITYTRCHDDIGLGYDDEMIAQAGFNPYEHRKFLKNYYAGIDPGSPARGALFSVNPKTQDARISGSLASLCGLEKALDDGDQAGIETSLHKIILMQAQSIFIGGLPMLFYGDEAGYTNDYSYLEDEGKNYDNRWMHRPVTDWEKNERTNVEGTIEERVFSSTQKLIQLRKSLPVVADHANINWLTPHNIHVAGFIRTNKQTRLYCLFNYSNRPSFVTWYLFKEHGTVPASLFDHWQKAYHTVGADHEYLVLAPYSFVLLEAI